MEIITVEIIPGIMPKPKCYASQHDNGRQIQLDLKENGEIFTLTGTEDLTLRVRKNNGEEITESVTNEGGDHVIIRITRDMTSEFGEMLCELGIETPTRRIGSANFILKVERAV